VTEPHFAFTVLKVADRGKRATKRIVGKSDGSREVFAYDRVSRWRIYPREIAGLDRMAAFLGTLATRPDLMIVMGAPRDGVNLSQPMLRRWANPEPTKNTLTDCPRGWLAIDVDGYGVPEPFGLAEHLADAAACVRDDALGEEFCDVACIVTASASTGLAGEDTVKCRLFFALDRPWPIATLHGWARGAQIAGLPVDPAVMQAGQPIYTSRPIFDGALRDPVPAAKRAFILPGAKNAVSLDVDRYAAAASEAERKIRIVEHVCCDDWRQLLETTLGRRGLSFFMPLTRALSRAARTFESEAAIIGWIQDIVARRADLPRQRQYGPQWCAATLRNFRQRDRIVMGDIATLRVSVFGEHSR
jgi:hypothetical protein